MAIGNPDTPIRRIALFADGGFFTHTMRVLEVGRALAHKYGYEIHFCCAGRYADLLREAGFPVRSVYTVDPELTLKLARRAGLCDLRWWSDVAERSVRSDMEAIADIAPDLVVGDLRMSLATSARAAHVPYVSITNASWTSAYADEIQVPEGHLSERLLGRRLAEALFPIVKRMLVWYWARGFDEVRKRLSLLPLRSLHDLIEGDVTLLADLPEFFPIRQALPSSFRYVGPIRFRATLPRPLWLSRLAQDRPTLYFSMGASGDAEFLDEAVRVFGGTKYQVLITNSDVPAQRFPHYDNVFVEKFADGDSMMAASHVAITRGDNVTIYQALGQGVPIMGIPTMFDQELNMRRVSALGTGLRLPMRGCHGESLQAAVETILQNPEYTDAAQRLRWRIADFNGALGAARQIEHYLRTGALTAHLRAVNDLRQESTINQIGKNSDALHSERSKLRSC